MKSFKFVYIYVNNVCVIHTRNAIYGINHAPWILSWSLAHLQPARIQLTQKRYSLMSLCSFALYINRMVVYIVIVSPPVSAKGNVPASLPVCIVMSRVLVVQVENLARTRWV